MNSLRSTPSLLRLPVLCAGLLALLCTAPVRADEGLLSRGSEALNQGKVEQARQLFLQASSAGDPVGDYGMGVLYFQGQGVEQDLAESSRWFRRAAEKGYPPAQYNLGNAYLHGRGLAADVEQAQHWWQKAAVRGYARAQYNLGILLMQRAPDALQREQGIAWLRASAELGFPKASDKLAELDEPVRFADVAADAARDLPRAEARLLTLDPDSFTIQLFSGRQPDSASRFLDSHDLRGDGLAFHFLSRGNRWTGVVFGHYADRAEARAVIDGLKPALKKIGPWIRAVGEVQAQILEARKAETGAGTPPT